MKSKIIFLFVCIGAVVLCMGAVDSAIQKTPQRGTSPYKGMCTSGTGNVANQEIGTLFGVADSIEIEAVGDDTFTIVISHSPQTDGTIEFSNKFTKLTKTVTNGTSNPEFAFETSSINSNVAIGALFTGKMYITVTDFSGSAWRVNVITKDESETNPSKKIQGGRY